MDGRTVLNTEAFSANSSGRQSDKAKAAGLKCHRSTQDGRYLCLAYNSANGRCDGSCGMVHACQICFGKHPKHRCEKLIAAEKAD